MLSRPSSSSSSSLSRKCPSDACQGSNASDQKKKKDSNIIKRKKNQRSPLQDLNGISRTNTSGSTGSSALSSSVSMEAPRGCLRFFIPSNPSSLRTPLHNKRTSASSSSRPSNLSVSSVSSKSKPSSENGLLSKQRNCQKPKKNPPTPNCLYQWQSGKKSASSKVSKSNLAPVSVDGTNNKVSGSDNNDALKMKVVKQRKQELPKQPVSGEPPLLSKINDLNNNDTEVENRTPTCKLQCGSALGVAGDGTSKVVQEEQSHTSTATKTPPVIASVSPEIQCGPSSMLVSSATAACYGAGHVLSGIADRRKCRPRGVLAVGCNDSSGCNMTNLLDDEDYSTSATENSSPPLIPLPAEASMRWLLSPCRENEEDDTGNDYALSNNANYSSKPDTVGNGVKTRITMLSPRKLSELSDNLERCFSSESLQATPSCEESVPEKEWQHQCTIVGESSAFSLGSLSSGNVIQTPKSETSPDIINGLSWSNSGDKLCHDFEFGCKSGTEAPWSSSLSPRSQISIWDPPGLSFQLTDLDLPSDSIPLDKFQKSLDVHASWMSNSSLENASRSQMRISWREGLMGRIFEMDEYDCCRYLSDEDIDVDICNKNQLKLQQPEESKLDIENDPSPQKEIGSPQLLDEEPIILGRGKASLSLRMPNNCAESICTNGGSLFSSEDSDWTCCYKNQLFQRQT